MTKKCEVCGQYCRKTSTRMYEEVWKCDNCGVRYPVGESKVHGDNGEVIRTRTYNEDHQIEESTNIRP